MEVGDTVTLVNDTSFRGTLLRVPRSVGRKVPRALVQTLSGEQWMPIGDLRKVEPENEQ